MCDTWPEPQGTEQETARLEGGKGRTERRKGVLGTRNSLCKGWEERTSMAPAGSCTREEEVLGERELRTPQRASNARPNSQDQPEGSREPSKAGGLIQSSLHSLV